MDFTETYTDGRDGGGTNQKGQSHSPCQKTYPQINNIGDNHPSPFCINNADSSSMEWSYIMRRDMQEIIPGLYLGPYAAALKSKLIYLKQMHITHIVCIRHIIEAHFIRPNFPSLFQYLVLDIADSVTENIISHFAKVKEFIDNCMAQGGRCLVHANAGISRSAALVIAYLMERFHQPFRETFAYVQQKRFCINPNEGFTQQLKEYEAIYKAKQDVLLANMSPSRGSWKRKCANDDDSMDDGKRWAVDDT